MTRPTPSEPTPNQGRWSNQSIPDNGGFPAATPSGEPESAVPARAGGKGGAGAVLDVLTTPLITTGLAAVLLVVSVIAFAVKWVTTGFSLSLAGQSLSLSATVNGFGMQKVSGDLGSDSALEGDYLAFAIVTLVLIVVGAVLVLAVPRVRKIGAIVLVLGGVVEVVYGVLIAAGVLGQDKEDVLGDDLDTLRSLSPELAKQFEDAFSFGTGAGPWIAIVAGVLVVALGVLYIVRAPGPVVPKRVTAPRQPAAPQDVPAGEPQQQFRQPEPGEGRWSSGQ
jgi:hypothetical protein